MLTCELSCGVSLQDMGSDEKIVKLADKPGSVAYCYA